MHNNIEIIFQKNIRLLRDMDRLIYYFRVQNFDNALRIGVEIINQLSSYIELLLKSEAYFNENNQLIDSDSVLDMVKNLMEAQENRDYILLADLYEISFLPLIIKLQEVIINKEGYTFAKENYNNTIDILKQSCPDIARHIQTLPAPDYLLDQGYYSIEFTSGGLMTLAAIDNGKKFYFHSNNRVQNEAFTLANSWYREEITDYIIYGLGLGYHLTELININNYVTIEIFERDINIIHLACAFSTVFKDLIARPNVKLHYDPDFTKLSNKLLSRNESTDFIIHHPSLRNIKNSQLKEKLENYFVQYNSVRNQLHLLNGNFNENIKHYDGLVDELHYEFQGKDLYIIAAGPSLDTNFLQLKNVGENSIIIATGTVYRKLINAGIHPDYVIVTDANPRVYGQIAGLEKLNIPMLLLSTAYYGFAKNYKGKKYLICQEDYNKAEDFAESKGYHLFRTGGSVSTTALDVGIQFNCRRIIFLGLDLAYTNSYVHAVGTSRRELTGTDDLRQIEDIHGNLIYTSRSLDMYRQWIENRIKGIKDIEFIDATEGGARIKGIKISKLSDII